MESLLLVLAVDELNQVNITARFVSSLAKLQLLLDVEIMRNVTVTALNVAINPLLDFYDSATKSIANTE